MGSLRVGHDWATNPTLNLQLKKLRDTCKPMAVSFQCMTKSTTTKKKKKKKKEETEIHSNEVASCGNTES